MKLILKESYLSIGEFEETDLPDFTVITGINGSGKSHLLSAIERGKIIINDSSAKVIARFTAESFKLKKQNVFNQNQLNQEVDALYNFVQAEHIRQQSNINNYINDAEMMRFWRERNCTLSELAQIPSMWQGAISAYINNLDQFFNTSYKHDPNSLAAYRIALKLSKPLSSATKIDLRELFDPNAYDQNLLPDQLSKIFLRYHLAYEKNRYYRIRNSEDGGLRPVLTEQQFFDRYGPKPWELINSALASIPGLKYRVNSPANLDLDDDFDIYLMDPDRPDLKIDFTNLSSGESTLLALVAAIFNFSINENRPNLILLDEVDASLHPTMMRAMLSVINEVFLKSEAKVILVTHSPTTVALAPEESLYLMRKTGRQRLSKANKQDALEILTDGFATLDGGLRLLDVVSKHQLSIFTEGYNAEIIEKALQLYEVSTVSVVRGIEDISGDSQLKTLFDFFSKIAHEKSVLFVWDCDVVKYRSLGACGNTFSYVFKENPFNKVAEKGIENAFPEKLFDGLKMEVKDSFGMIRETFDPKRKADFKSRVVDDATKEDFNNFSELIALVQTILK